MNFLYAQINTLDQPVHKVRNFSEKIYLYYSVGNTDKVKKFFALHDKVTLLTRTCSERETRIVTKEFVERF